LKLPQHEELAAWGTELPETGADEMRQHGHPGARMARWAKRQVSRAVGLFGRMREQPAVSAAETVDVGDVQAVVGVQLVWSACIAMLVTACVQGGAAGAFYARRRLTVQRRKVAKLSGMLPRAASGAAISTLQTGEPVVLHCGPHRPPLRAHSWPALHRILPDESFSGSPLSLSPLTADGDFSEDSLSDAGVSDGPLGDSLDELASALSC